MSGMEFFTEPTAFLARAGEHLARQPLTSTVVTSVTRRISGELSRGVPADPAAAPIWWMAATDDDGTVVGAGMRTAPFAPYPLYLLPMPDEAAVGLARTLYARGELVGGVNGALPAARLCAEETARLTGHAVRVAMHTRLFELGTLVSPAPVPGSIRPARVDEAALVRDWFGAFIRDAEEQGGRDPQSAHGEVPAGPDAVARPIEARDVWLWVDAGGEPVNLTGVNPPSLGVARIGPVYTPAAHRRRGYASAAVAAVSQRLLDQGVRVCLFTDQANPTSNGVYQRLGYRPVVDMVNLVIE